MVIMKIVSESKDEWLLFDEKTVLLSKSIMDIIGMRNNGVKFDSLPELIEKYQCNPYFFNSKIKENIAIFTDTNEILGIDTEGRIYRRNEKVIIHTHGIFVNAKNNSDFSLEGNVLSEQEFDNLLQGKIQSAEQEGKIRVYREDELKRKSKSKIEFPCITVLPGQKYLKDPEYFCTDLEYIAKEYGFRRNGLLISRTLSDPEKLMNFIKEEVTYFRQTSPLIEPILLNGKNGAEKLFEKYIYRVMPLILRDGEISKDADDAINIFSEKKQTESSFFVAISK